MDSLNVQIKKNSNNYDLNLRNFTDKINDLNIENEQFKNIIEKNCLLKPQKENSLMYNPKLSIKICLTASKKY